MWQQDPTAKLQVQVLITMCAAGKGFKQETMPRVMLEINRASRLWDSFQIRSVLQTQRYSPDKGR